MKLAILADIHSNHIALKEALDYIDKVNVEGLIFLGDYVSDCPYPQKTMQLLYEYKNKYNCYFIRGNREDYLISHHKNPNDGWCYASSSGSLLYTYENLTNEDIDFFASMPISMKIQVADYPALLICHGSPENTKEWIMGKEDLIDKYSKSIDTDYLFCGHTHRDGICEANGKLIMFCPSVGLPTNRSTDAQLTLLEFKNEVWETQIIYLKYDREKLIDEFYKSGLCEKAKIWAKSIIKLINVGLDFSLQCVNLAWEKAKDDETVKNGILPEKYWEEAAKELGIE